MTLLELLTEWRRRLDDSAAPFLWSKEDGVSYVNQAEREACERAKLIHDNTTPAVCNIAGKASTGTYKLHPSILEITSLYWNGIELAGISRSQLDNERRDGWRGYGWNYAGGETNWSALTGSPDFFIAPQEKYLTLVRIPTVAAPIRLTAYRYPLNDMKADGDEPEIADRHQFNLVDWMLYLSYRKQDSETFNPKGADDAEASFIKNFGTKIDANIRRQQRERRSNQVRMNPGW